MISLFKAFTRFNVAFIHILKRKESASCYFEAMKLYTDKFNPLTLRILVADKLAETNLTVEYVEKNESLKRFPFLKETKLPFLEVENDHYLFSANAITRYLLKCETHKRYEIKVENLSFEDHWLEWDLLKLQPSMFSFLASSFTPNCSMDVSNIKECLSHLESHLKPEAKYIAGNKLSLSDVVVWGTLYPLLAQSSHVKELDINDHFCQVMTWFNNLMENNKFYSLSQAITEGKGPDVFKEAILAYNSSYSIPCTKKDLRVPEAPTKNLEQDENVHDVDEMEINEAIANWQTKKIPKRRVLEHPILPKDGEKNILITSALPYVNNVPHLGNIIGCVLSADVFARFCRLRQHNVLYICGTDEYGTASETKALEEGVTPAEICTKYFKIHREVYEWFNIQFDYFGRTTTEEQTKISQDIFWQNYKNGLTLEDTVEQLHCESCNKFLADRFVEGTCPLCGFHDARGDQCDACGKLINATELKSPRCKICGKTPSVKKSRHLFLDLTKLQPELTSWVEKSSSEGNWSANSQHITKGWLQEGLKPRCITRDLKWGTPVPLEGFTDKVFYVWFDAPIGYLSITANYTEHWQKWWKNPKEVSLYQFMAKDNVPFHTVVFPATLLGTREPYTMLNNINATEYLNYEDGKFSKSRGVGVFGNNAKDTGIPADIWRFYLLQIRPESQDSIFTWAEFAMRNNSELLNSLGNFINRALVFLNNNFKKKMPAVILNDEDKRLITLVNRELKQYIHLMDLIKLRDGLKIVLNISKLGNQYIQSNKPWVLVKGSDMDRTRAGSVIALACNLTGLLSILIHPFMPNVSAEIRKQLQPKPLFDKIDSNKMEEFRKLYSGQNSGEKGEKSKKTDEEIKALESDVAKQGDIVRKLKADKAEKTTIDAEVLKLLDFKKKLNAATGVIAEEFSKNRKKPNRKK
ncbi:methionine--tRNA ligase, cytoplasmic-like isoform X2 [Xenia sp. Carnegie-2017]|uniref:methionine--tRNA ligase, cytoplasmic-like isoform X2 n=1 Tax=Xenia sp. Carnegie-2017 TaxID=2897299 RepID=UPI001F0481F7|nr:methionine--tRNA ligase, cytoplasmic-like isoform X2 [Xenia sp. Carnegie-2017]